MDKGAHFYRCDFQIHSPRDRSWTGGKFGANTDEVGALNDEAKESIIESKIQFANEYLEKIRVAGLNAMMSFLQN